MGRNALKSDGHFDFDGVNHCVNIETEIAQKNREKLVSLVNDVIIPKGLMDKFNDIWDICGTDYHCELPLVNLSNIPIQIFVLILSFQININDPAIPI